MDQIEEFVDERQKSWCIHCGGWMAELDTNLDHVPSKSLLLEPNPAHLPVVPICKRCNEGFSLDEQYLMVFLSCVLSGSTDPEKQRNEKVKRALKRRPKLGSQIERSKTEFLTLFGEKQTVWQPEWDRVNRIILKNARGHAFYEYGEPMLDEPDNVWSAPFVSLTPEQRAEFENIDLGDVWPEVGSRMMSRVLTGQDLRDGWVIVQEGTYRYGVAPQGTLLVRSVLFEYLATEVYWGG